MEEEITANGDKLVRCKFCGCTTNLSEFPEYGEGEMNHWRDCNQLLGEDETPEE
jgi:hypothetical protein